MLSNVPVCQIDGFFQIIHLVRMICSHFGAKERKYILFTYVEWLQQGMPRPTNSDGIVQWLGQITGK